MFAFVRNYRATPDFTKGKPPADLLFRRPMKLKLSQVPFKSSNDKIGQVDRRKKYYMKSYADQIAKTRYNSFEVGQMVLVIHQKKHKFSIHMIANLSRSHPSKAL